MSDKEEQNVEYSIIGFELSFDVYAKHEKFFEGLLESYPAIESSKKISVTKPFPIYDYRLKTEKIHDLLHFINLFCLSFQKECL